MPPSGRYLVRCWPYAGAECVAAGGFFITTKPARSRNRATWAAAIVAIMLSARRNALRPSNWSAWAKGLLELGGLGEAEAGGVRVGHSPMLRHEQVENKLSCPALRARQITLWWGCAR